VIGDSIKAIVLYVHTGTDSTSRLIMYQPTARVTALMHRYISKHLGQ
jgi:hypothetical protein